jgi:hypothetical protein
MQGWVDAIPYIKTKYSMLLHNDGYALDSFFGCELLQSLKYHQLNSPNGCAPHAAALASSGSWEQYPPLTSGQYLSPCPLPHLPASPPPRRSYVLAAPMLCESKMDGSLAAHATQTNLRLVKDDSPQGMTVHHDHSLRRALNRGFDFKEGDQTEVREPPYRTLTLLLT